MLLLSILNQEEDDSQALILTLTANSSKREPSIPVCPRIHGEAA